MSETEWVTEDMLPEGMSFVVDGDEVVGITFPTDRELTEEEEALVGRALEDRGLPPLHSQSE